MTNIPPVPDVLRRWQRRGRWFALMWLFYVVYPIYQLIASPYMTVLHRTAGIAGTVLFLALYIGFYFRQESPSPRHIIVTATIFVGIGAYLVWTVNGNFYSFFIYAGVVLAALDNALWFMGFTSAVGGATVLLMALRGFSWLTIFFMVGPLVLISVVMFGFYRYMSMTMKLGRAESEIRRLAEAETRMRITQDVHDVLGQSLSTIVLQADVAARTPETGPSDMEAIAHLARQALGELRQVVQGRHLMTLTEAINQAQKVLEVANLTCQVPQFLPSMARTADSVLALVLREAVTNVIRHSQARRCTMHVTKRNGQVLMTIEDDGVGYCEDFVKGQGLLGMTRRVALIGGRLDIGSSKRMGGWRIRVQLSDDAS